LQEKFGVSTTIWSVGVQVGGKISAWTPTLRQKMDPGA
jgi:hypothetical protein